MPGLNEPGVELRVHFIGIGGISMSGLAEILAAKGHHVSGCDRRASQLTARLADKGIEIEIGHDPRHVENVDLVVYTAAINREEPELIAAGARGCKVIERAALLGEVAADYPVRVAVAGTHGKTTTTGMIGVILAQAGLDPTISLGGELDQIGGNVRLGQGRIFLAEACEYVESFLHLSPTIGVILNIEPDHPDFFRDLTHLKEAFRRFAALVPASGKIVARTELPNVAEAVAGAQGKLVSFGQAAAADFHAEQISFDTHGLPSFVPMKGRQELGRVKLSVPGLHNVHNSLAALAVADLLGVKPDKACEALGTYQGTKRRFERKGSFAGATVIDDYAHHPTEIRATLAAAKNCPHKKIWCVFQPHTFSRTKSLLDDFASALSLADRVVVADIYAAREVDRGEVHARDLAGKIVDLGYEALYIPSFGEIVTYLSEHTAPGDLILTMGAGDVSRVGEMLLSRD